MSNDNTKNLSPSWGSDLTILCYADFNFLPGAYALFNSAILNGFAGSFKILVNKLGGDFSDKIAEHKQLSSITYEGFTGNYQVYVHRLPGLTKLPPGKYLYLDADIIFERPCGHLFEALDEGLVVSSEPYSKYDPLDVLIRQQCKQTGLSCDLKPFPYVNAGLLGFMLPRDQQFIDQLVQLTQKHMIDIDHPSKSGNWFFLDQDLLNLLIRQKNGLKAFSISNHQLEFGCFANVFQDRPFPYIRQGDLQPADQVKYIIHGASLPRPWLPRKRSGIKGQLISAMERSGIKALIKKPSPYERAWAYYALSDNLPIPLSAWADKHGFTSDKNCLWRKAYGLS